MTVIYIHMEKNVSCKLHMYDCIIMECSSLTIFHAGQIDELESLFTYPPGQSHSSFANDAIWYPTFLDAIVSTASNDILAACNGDQQCIFDYATTGNVAIGVSTMETNQDFSTSMAESSEFYC